MGITVNTSPQQITASVGETKIDVSVSGGIGPTGPAGEVGGGYTLPVATASVLGGVKIGSGISIDGSGVISVSSASVAWNDITGKPSTFTPSAHTHGGGDISFTAFDTAFSAGTDSPVASFLWGVDQGDSGHLVDNFLKPALDNSYAFVSHQHSATADLTFAGATAGQVLTVNSGATALVWATPTTYSLPVATSSVLGGVKQGSNVTIDGSGVISVAAPFSGAYADLTGKPTLGTAAALNTGTTAGTVAAGDHTHTQLHDRSHAITSSSDHTATAWRLFYSNGSGVITELTLGSSGQALLSNGASAAPSWGSAGSNSASDLTVGTLAYARMADPTVTSPSQITASQNDYASFARGINRFTTNAARDLTGMVAGSDGEVRVLTNVGTTAANTLTIKDQSASSTAANRFAVPWAGDCVIPNGASVVCYYDNTTSRWRVIA